MPLPPRRSKLWSAVRMRDRHGRGLFHQPAVELYSGPACTPTGHFVGQFQIDTVAGSAFGIAVEERDGRILFAAVDDNLSVLDEWAEKE